MLNLNQVSTMLSLQSRMNSMVNPNWVNQDWDLFRASMMEGCEAVEHHGWKWWKAQTKDVSQLQMELVDIWHFYLSQFLKSSCGNVPQALLQIEEHYKDNLYRLVRFDGVSYRLGTMDLLSKLDLLIGLSASKRLNVNLLLAIVNDSGMTWKLFFDQYVRKNVLNMFRQQNGYKQGTYHKDWFGKEDNVFLIEEAEKLNPDDADYAEQLWKALTAVYQEALKHVGCK